MKTIIDFSKCSNEDVAELLAATDEPCFWLCNKHAKHDGHRCAKCPGGLAVMNIFVLPHRYYHREQNSVCVVHENRFVTKPEIERQCWSEIGRRGCEMRSLRRKGEMMSELTGPTEIIILMWGY